MDQKPGHEIGPFFIRFKDRQWRAVFLDGPDDLRDAGAASFREAQFLEKFADAPVPVTAGYAPAGSQVLQVDGTVRSGIAGDGDTVRQDAYLDGFPDLVTAVLCQGNCYAKQAHASSVKAS